MKHKKEIYEKMKRKDFGESMCDETKLKVLNFVERQLRLKHKTMTTDNGYTAEQVKEYYLNSGFTQYQEDEFISYSDLDWIEYANESELELN